MAIDNEMGERLEKVEHGLKQVEHALEKVEHGLHGVEQRLEKVEHGLDKVDQKVDDLATATKIRFEGVRDDIKKLGEGYEDGLRQISQQLRDLDTRWADKWTPHDLALQNHGKRITALEQQTQK